VDSDEVRQEWADRSGAYSPEYYAYYGPNETSDRIGDWIEGVLDQDASVLELGCSAGRHLSALYDRGFTDLHGIELNDDAIAVMEDTYPELAAETTVYVDSIESVVGEFADEQFDAVYSVETLQHLHPDADWVFAELERITGSVLITAEHEGETTAVEKSDPGVNYVDDEFPLYYRDWHRVFTDLGMEQVDARQLDRDTLRFFRTN